MNARRAPQKPAGQPNQLRIIAGKWRSRRLDFPTVHGLRPTGDRIRETLFNWLAPEIAGARCLDAFAGSGALGFEALSRGADEVIFIENNPTACMFLRQNRESLQAGGAQIVAADALPWLAGADGRVFDIIFIDPPFARSLQNRCLAEIHRGGLCRPGSLIYLESPRDYVPALPGNWRTTREKFSGDVAYRLVEAR